MAEGLDWTWCFVPELFEVDETLQAGIDAGIAPDPREFEEDYRAAIAAVLADAKLEARADQRPILGGRRGHHSEHLGHLLAAIPPRPAPTPTRPGRMAEDFHSLRSPRSSPETAEARSIRFDVPEELRETFAFKPGQHLTLSARSAARRCAAIIRSASRPRTSEVMVTVKRIAGGVFSNWATTISSPATRST